MIKKARMNDMVGARNAILRALGSIRFDNGRVHYEKGKPEF